MTTKSRVVVVEKPLKIDLKSVEGFGDVNFIFGDGRRMSVMRCVPFMKAVYDRLVELKFDPQVDRFCITPPILPTTLALMAVARYCGEQAFKIVVFNSGFDRYEERVIDMKEVSCITP